MAPGPLVSPFSQRAEARQQARQAETRRQPPAVPWPGTIYLVPHRRYAAVHCLHHTSRAAARTNVYWAHGP